MKAPISEQQGHGVCERDKSPSIHCGPAERGRANYIRRPLLTMVVELAPLKTLQSNKSSHAVPGVKKGNGGSVYRPSKTSAAFKE